MPIQFVPGPFSFLEKFGEAGGRAFAAAEEQKRHDQGYSRDLVRDMFQAVQSGTLSANALKSPFFADLIGRSGIADSWDPANVRVNPAERIATIQDEEVQRTERQPVGSTERRQVAAGGAPVTATAAGTEAARAQAINQGGAAGRVVTGVPAEQVAGSAEQAAISAGIAPEAARIVDEAVAGQEITRENFEATVDRAVEIYAQSIGQASNMVPDAARRYFAGALTDRLYDQLEAQTRRVAAMQRGEQNDARYLALLNQAANALTGFMNQVPEPTDQERIIANAFASKLRQMQSMTPEEQQRIRNSPGFAFQEQNYNRVQRYDRIQQGVQSTVEGLTGAVAGRVGEGGRVVGQPPGVPGATTNPNDPVESAARMLLTGQGTLDQLNDALQNGSLTQQEYQQIINRYGEMRKNQGRR